MASWALSFERLLQDPVGLAYFTVSPGVGWNGRGGCLAVRGLDRASGCLVCCHSVQSPI